MLHNKNGKQIIILICLFCVSVFAQAKSSDSVVPNQQLKPGQMPDGLSASHWGSIQSQIRTGKYKAYPDEKGGFNSSNPAHGWQIRYGANGATTLSSHNRDLVDYRLGLKLNAIGYQTLKSLDRPEKISSQGNTLDYRWNEILTERWINKEKDLEQWFFLTQRPAGAANGHPLTLQMTLDSTLKASQQENNIRFSNPSSSTTIT